MNDMPGDSGPIYLETVMGRLPVEPWNTFSNLLFLALIVYWTWRLVREGVGPHRFIAGALPVLFVGWVGGTVYHATRSANVWLYLDFGPIALLVAAAAIFFWRRVGVAWLWVPFLVFGPFAVVMTTISALDLPDASRPYLGYPTLALSLLLPVLWNLAREQWADIGIVVAALAVFAGAVTFRTPDGRALADVLPMGTHWLWHSFGAGAVQLLILYIWRSDGRALRLGTSPPHGGAVPAQDAVGEGMPSQASS